MGFYQVGLGIPQLFSDGLISRFEHILDMDFKPPLKFFIDPRHFFFNCDRKKLSSRDVIPGPKSDALTVLIPCHWMMNIGPGPLGHLEFSDSILPLNRHSSERHAWNGAAEVAIGIAEVKYDFSFSKVFFEPP